MSLNVQFHTLWMMLLSGVALGVAFDAYRVVAGHYRAARWMIPIIDIFYWLLATLFVFKMLYDSNEGQLRFFVFIGIAIGICFHFALTSTPTVKLFKWTIRAIEATVRFLVRVVDIVVFRPIVFIYRLGWAILGYLAAISIFLLKIMIQLLYPIRWLLLMLWRPIAKRIAWPGWAKRVFRFVQEAFKRLF